MPLDIPSDWNSAQAALTAQQSKGYYFSFCALPLDSGYTAVNTKKITTLKTNIVPENHITKDELDLKLKLQESKIDARMSSIETKFEMILERFDSIDKRFDKLEEGYASKDFVRAEVTNASNKVMLVMVTSLLAAFAKWAI